MRRRGHIADLLILIGYFRAICDVTGDVTDSSKFICHFSSNLRRRSDVSDLSRFIAYFRPICDVAETLQIRQNLLVIFRQITQRCRRFVKRY